MADFMPMIHAERGSLAEFLGTLTPEQWTAPTWCDKWNVQQVTGHLVAAANITAPHFFSGLAMTGFSFDAFVDKDLRTFAAGTPAEVKQRFDGIINSTRTPPGPKYVALGEVMVHGETSGVRSARRAITRPSTSSRWPSSTRRRARRCAKKRVAGLKLTATDVDWSTGDGPEVSGPAMSLILAMVGRTKALDDCTGAGVETLRARA